MTLEEQYKKLITDHILVNYEDLSIIEKQIVDFGWSIVKNKFQDLKIVEDEVKRLNIELANLKAMYLNNNNNNDDYDDDNDDTED